MGNWTPTNRYKRDSSCLKWVYISWVLFSRRVVTLGTEWTSQKSIHFLSEILENKRLGITETVKVKSLSPAWPFPPHWLWPARLFCPWDSPGKNTGVRCHFLLQGIFPTQRSNTGLPHCRQILHRLSHQRGHGILRMVPNSPNFQESKDKSRSKRVHEIHA